MSTSIELKTTRSGTKAPTRWAFVENVECGLLFEWNLAQPKLHDQCIFVELLNDSMAKCVKDLDRPADNLKDFVLER
jgi:hypothetical protein